MKHASFSHSYELHDSFGALSWICHMNANFLVISLSFLYYSLSKINKLFQHCMLEIVDNLKVDTGFGDYNFANAYRLMPFYIC